MTMMTDIQVYPPQTAAALSKAVQRASEYLGLKQKEFAQIVGLSQSKVSRLWANNYELNPLRKSEWENSILFIRLFTSLDGIVGDKESARIWLRGPNIVFGDSPFNVIQSVEGLVNVVKYLDASGDSF